MDIPSLLPQLTSQTSGNETRVNELIDAVSPPAVFGRDASTTGAATWGYLGGRYGGTAVTSGTVALTVSSTNYVVASRTTLAVSVSTATTNWNNPAAYFRLYKVTMGSAQPTAVEDHRAGPRGPFAPTSPPPSESVASASTIAITPGQRVVNVTGTTNISTITATGHDGAVVTLIFAGSLTVNDGSNLKLAGNFSTAANATLTLACDGTNWYECSRSTN